MSSIHTRLQKKLEERSQKGNLRSLRVNEAGIDFCSNDYLGLSRLEDIAEVDEQKIGGSSRLISGTSQIHLDTEKELATKYNHAGALIFNSGYAANCGLFSSLGLKDVVFLYDERAHASIKDGLRLSFAKSFSFLHNNLNDLERLLKKFTGHTTFVVVESLYSIDGDFAPLLQIGKLLEQYDAELIVDEAHTGGLFGDQGYCEEIQLPLTPFARIITFGKAYGSAGACVLSSKIVIDFLINFSRPFIYTTALSKNQVKDIQRKVLHLKLTDRQVKLKENIAYFREKAKEMTIISDKYSPIQSLLIPTNLAARQEELKIQKNGFDVKAILSPTVPEGRECIRISLHSFNTKLEIDQLIEQL